MNEHNIRESMDAFVESSEHTPGIETLADCCLCGENCSSLLQLRNHLGDHQRQLALFALPPLNSEEHDSDEDVELGASGSSDDNSSVVNEGQDEDFVDLDQPQEVGFFPSIHQQQATQAQQNYPVEGRPTISELAERRRMQNRIAQRNYRTSAVRNPRKLAN